MTEKQIKRFYRWGLFLGMFIPIIFIMAISLGKNDMNFYYAVVYLGMIPVLMTSIGSIIWTISFLTKWLSEKTIHIKNFKIPFLLNSFLFIIIVLFSLLRFI